MGRLDLKTFTRKHPPPSSPPPPPPPPPPPLQWPADGGFEGGVEERFPSSEHLEDVALPIEHIVAVLHEFLVAVLSEPMSRPE